MIKSESIKELAGALSKFQGEVTNPKNTAKNPQFNSKYAPLQDILSLVRPLLSKQGLSLLQTTTGDLEGVTIITILLHESGEFLETDPFVLKGEQSIRGGGKVLNVQGAGSMITYLRRYQISALLGLSSEDDDGNHASEKADNSKKITPNEEPHKGVLNDAQVKRLYAIANSIGYDHTTVLKHIVAKYKLTSTTQLSKAQYEELCKGYEGLKAKKESEKNE